MPLIPGASSCVELWSSGVSCHADVLAESVSGTSTWVPDRGVPESEAESDWEDFPVQTCFVVAGTVISISGT